jgi:hypothetical protein
MYFQQTRKVLVYKTCLREQFSNMSPFQLDSEQNDWYDTAKLLLNE